MRVLPARASDATVDVALGLLVAVAAATVGRATSASVTLDRSGRLQTVASSDDTGARLDDQQYADGQGPCVAAATAGQRFHVRVSTTETRWPAFIPHALDAGVASILSTPLLVEAEPVGALNVYSWAAQPFGRDQQDLADLLAGLAAGIVSDARTDPPRELALRFHDALRAREVIARAQGVLMERAGVSADAAEASLRRSSRQAGVPIRRLATDTVASTIRPEHPDLEAAP